MADLARELDAFWISKLGVGRVTDLKGGLIHGDPLDRARSVVRAMGKDRKSFYGLIQEGFDGYFHQWVYVRSLPRKAATAKLAAVPVGKVRNGLAWWMVPERRRKTIRVLGALRTEMAFLSRDEAIRKTVPIPVMVEASASWLRTRVLTVQSTATTWSDLLHAPIQRVLTPLRAERLVDLLHKAIEHMGMDTGKIWNLSAKAAGLMVDIARVHTYSGTYGVRKVGRTRHTTEGGRPGRHRRPLHEVMREDFEELVSAEDIRDCEIKIQKPLHGLVPGTAVVLNPAAGRCVFREMLGKDRISVFLDYLVK